MKKFSLYLYLCLSILFSSENAYAKTFKYNISQFNNSRQWHFNNAQKVNPFQFKTPTTLQDTIGPADSYGLLQGPDNTNWSYTITFTKKESFYNDATIKIFNNKNELVGEINEDFDINAIDNDSIIGVNFLDINPIISKKFFNTDNNYEIMVFIHAVTKSYKGRYLNHVYSLGGSKKVCVIEGTHHLAKNTSLNSYSEAFTMIFQRQTEENDSTYLCYDIYNKASYNSPNNPELKHTFKVNYANIASSGNEPSPIFLIQNGKNINYVISQYEKPYFILKDINKDPEVNADNNLLITYYDDKFNPIHITKIPVVQDPKYLYVFPCLGKLNLSEDIIANYNNTGKPAYVITIDNYFTESDSYITSFYLYDVEGNIQKTIIEETIGHIPMSDIAGQPSQIAFLKENGNAGDFIFVDIPTFTTIGKLPILTKDGIILSTNIDRYSKDDSYQYVVSLLQGEVDKDNNVLQKIAWFNIDGNLDHYDVINLGKNIENAIIYIDNKALNPWLFNTDVAREYMALVYRSKPNTTKKEEALLVCNTNGEILMESAESNPGSNISMIYLINLETNPTLLCTYTDGNTHTLNFTPLPLTESPIEGNGTKENPYKIKIPYNFLQINNNPSAYYEIVNDIDFMHTLFQGVSCEFTGKLNGNNHTIKNLILNNNGLFHTIKDSAIIENIILTQPLLTATNKAYNIGFIANTIMGGFSDNAVEIVSTIKNIQLYKPTIKASTDFTGTLGGIAGEALLYTQIQESSLINTYIEAENANNIGGIAGRVATSATIEACAFTGEILGGTEIGGIAANTDEHEKIINCHTNAYISGTKTMGGIVGNNERSIIKNCYAEGSLELRNTSIEGRIGGIVGELGFSYDDTTSIVISNCLVGINTITIPNNNIKLYAHRIVGFSSSDDFEYDWDNIDYEKPQDEWPKIYGSNEKCLKNNYVISTLSAFDSSIELTDTTTEGATLEREKITTEWLQNHNFIIGENINAPWAVDEENNIHLWFEQKIEETNVEYIEQNNNSITFNGTIINANGTIRIYNINGILIQQSKNSINTDALNKGIYIITVSNNSNYSSHKILIP